MLDWRAMPPRRKASAAEPVFLAVIPARAGSKGVPGKNIRLLAGRPLIAWTVEAALAARRVTHVAVSSDSEEILAAGAVSDRVLRIRRPDALGRDDTAMLDVYRHAVQEFERQSGRRVDFLVGLQPTSPFRSAEDIDACIERAVDVDAETLVSVRAARENPYFVQIEPDAKDPRWYRQVKKCRVVRRQDLPPVFVVNGAVYVFRREALFARKHLYDARRFGVYEMPWVRSVDLDSEDDFLQAEFLLAKGAVRLAA